MTYLDHDLGPQGPTRAPAKPVTAQRTAAPMLDLQRLAGNAAVSQALRRAQSGSGTAVQRVQADEEQETEGYENDTEVAEEAAQAGQEAAEAEAYGETESEESKESEPTEGYANDTEEAEETEVEAEAAEEAVSYGGTAAEGSEEEREEG